MWSILKFNLRASETFRSLMNVSRKWNPSFTTSTTTTSLSYNLQQQNYHAMNSTKASSSSSFTLPTTNLLVTLTTYRSISFKDPATFEKLDNVKVLLDNSIKTQEETALHTQKTIIGKNTIDNKSGLNTTTTNGIESRGIEIEWDGTWTYELLADTFKEEPESKNIKIVENLHSSDESVAPVLSEETHGSKSSSCPSSELQVTVQDGIRTILFNRPAQYNALTLDMLLEFPDILSEANDDENTKIILLTGSGNYFCSGYDFNNFSNITYIDLFVEYNRRLCRNYVAAFIDCRKPIIALVNGPAIGIGVTMLGLFDAVYSSDSATFSAPFTSFGQCPEGCSTYTFPKIMGYSRTSELLYFSAKITAKQAYEWGLVTEVFPSDQFRSSALAKVQQVASIPTQALIFTKELVRGHERDTLHKVNDAECNRLKERWGSKDCLETVEKYLTRKPKN